MFTVKISEDGGRVVGKLADAELHFTGDRRLDGLKLIGFAIWERRDGSGRNVTFPSRTYSVNGDRRTFALLRPVDGRVADVAGPIRDAILQAYAEHVGEAPRAGGPAARAVVEAPKSAAPAEAVRVVDVDGAERTIEPYRPALGGLFAHLGALQGA